MSDVRVKRNISCQYYINACLGIMYAHDASSIFFNENNKGCTSRTLATPLHPITFHFCLTPYLPPAPPNPSPIVESYVYHLLSSPSCSLDDGVVNKP